jgi:hypothetical protein
MLIKFILAYASVTFEMQCLLYDLAGFQVLTAAGMKVAVFWVVVPCSLVEIY